MMKKLTRAALLAAAAFLLAGVTACEHEDKKKDEGNSVSVTGVTLDKTEATVSVGESITLTSTVTPTNATNKKVTWESSDTKVATVNGGTVTGVNEGTANITVTTVDGRKTAVCEVTVTPDTPIAVTATWDFSTSPEGFPTDDSNAINDVELAVSSGAGATLTATGRWKFQPDPACLQSQASSNVTVADATNWKSANGGKWLTLTLEGDATVTITYSGAGGIDPKRFIAVLDDADNAVKFSTTAEGIGASKLDEELTLTKGTYTIALNGARIYKITCKNEN